MSVIISGSIAYDTVFTHEGRFADTLRAEALDRLNVTLQADSMRRTYGGCAANIAYSLKQPPCLDRRRQGCGRLSPAS